MRVDLRGGEAGVAEQLLHRAQVGAGVDHVRRRGVPQRMWAKVRATCKPACVLVDDATHRSLIEAPPSCAEPERGPAVAPGGAGAAEPQPLVERPLGCPSVGDAALLAPFAEYAHDAAAPVDVVDVEPRELADPDSGAVQQLDDQPVP